jgi:hypothetical protein
MTVAEKLHDEVERPDLKLVQQLLGQALTLLDGDLVPGIKAE